MEEVVADVVEAENDTTTLRPVQGTMTPLNVVAKEMNESEDDSDTTTLRPVQKLIPLSTKQKEDKTASITPVRPQMIQKKKRGPPPSSSKGEKPSSDES